MTKMCVEMQDVACPVTNVSSLIKSFCSLKSLYNFFKFKCLSLA